MAYLPSGSTGVTASPTRYMTQPFEMSSLSPVLFMHVGHSYILPFEIFDILVPFVSPMGIEKPEVLIGMSKAVTVSTKISAICCIYDMPWQAHLLTALLQFVGLLLWA